MAKKLTALIADVAARPQASAKNKNRAAFLALRSEIKEAIEQGWTLAMIWRTLRDNKKIGMHYQSFWRYANALIPNHEQPSSDQMSVDGRPGEKPTSPGNPEQQPRVARSSAMPKAFKHSNKPSEDLF